MVPSEAEADELMITVSRLLAIMAATLVPLNAQIAKFLGYPGVPEIVLLLVVGTTLAQVIAEYRFPDTTGRRRYFNILASTTAFAWSALITIGAVALTAGAGLAVFAIILVIYFALGGLFSILLNRELQRRLVVQPGQPTLPAAYAGVFAYPFNFVPFVRSNFRRLVT